MRGGFLSVPSIVMRRVIKLVRDYDALCSAALFIGLML